jgi:hypothetical protein
VVVGGGGGVGGGVWILVLNSPLCFVTRNLVFCLNPSQRNFSCTCDNEDGTGLENKKRKQDIRLPHFLFLLIAFFKQCANTNSR